MTSSTVCVDASVLIKLVLDEEGSDTVRRMWGEWLEEGTEVVAPRLLYYETTSTLRNKVYRDEVSFDGANSALDTLLDLKLTLVEPPDRYRSAWRLATRYNRPTAYDANYLAQSPRRLTAHSGQPMDACSTR